MATINEEKKKGVRGPSNIGSLKLQAVNLGPVLVSFACVPVHMSIFVLWIVNGTFKRAW